LNDLLAIFYGSGVGREKMKKLGFNEVWAQTMPPLIIGMPDLSLDFATYPSSK
jgi:hypothetical protein